MIVTADLESSRAGRTERNFSGGGTGATTDFIAGAGYRKTGKEPFPTPQAFLVEQDAHSVIRPHFHMENQFQIIVAGGGTMGRHAVRAFSVHYASRQTGYGPLTAGPEGLSYFTLRQMADTGVFHLPESRDKQDKDLTRFQATSEPVDTSDAQALARRCDISTEMLLENAPNGMGAWCLRLPPGASMHAVSSGSGRFYVVAAGAMRVDGKDFPVLSTIFVSQYEDFEIRAADSGLEVVAMQYPNQEA